MSTTMNITKGRIETAKKVVIYGPEGIGKSTFASQFPDPLFIDTEGSTKEMDVARFDKPTSWELLKSQIEYVKLNKPCATLIIDTIDWAEQLCIKSICDKYDKRVSRISVMATAMYTKRKSSADSLICLKMLSKPELTLYLQLTLFSESLNSPMSSEAMTAGS